jgi:N4-gp56 family major capsid protein
LAFIEILTGNGLTVEQWENNIFKEYIGQLFWKHVMGKTPDSIIQVKNQLQKAKGDAITFGLRGRIQGGKVTGNNKGIGNEGTLDFYNQRVVVDNFRRLVKFKDVPMTEQRTMFNVMTEGKEALIEIFGEDTDDDITTALTDTSTGRVRGRYLYGAVDSNWNATHATALQNVDNTSDKLTVAMVDVARRKATNPVNAVAKIRPAKIKLGGVNAGNEEWYVFLGHTFSMRDLMEDDASWKNAELNLPPNPQRTSPIFTGSTFKGARNGVLYHDYDRMPLVASTIQVSHNLLLGAQAGFMAWAQRAKFGDEPSDVGHDITFELHEIRNTTKAVFDRATPEDHGLVNVFAAAVAD